MTIIEIQPLDNGAHRNQTSSMTTVPEGWAILPADLDTPNFPFGDIEIEYSNPPIIISWAPREIPEVEEEVEEVPTQLDIIEA